MDIPSSLLRALKYLMTLTSYLLLVLTFLKCIFFGGERYMKQFILPALVHLQEIEKFHMKRKLNQEEIDSKLQSMTPEARLRKGPALSNVEVITWPWRIRQPKTPPKALVQQDSKILEEIMGKHYDWSHLKRSRQRKKMESIDSDIEWAKKVNAVRMHAAAENAKESEKAQAVHSMEVKEQKALALEMAKLKELPAPSSSSDA